MKKIFFSLLVLFGVCGVTMSQTPYKVLKVHKNGEVTHTLNLSDIDSLTVRTVGETPDTPDVPGDDTYEYVDLGLPSGTLWATTNVGAASPADYGDYFAWGEISPKADYDWDTYKLCNGSKNTLTKYNTDSSCGTVDNKTVLEAVDDAATVNWGSDWCMPTSSELEELSNTDNCTWTWTTRTNSKGESINGYLVTSKFNGNSIFMPAAGCYGGTSLSVAGSFGEYWTSSLDTDNPSSAFYFLFQTEGRGCFGSIRYLGMPVRPVRAKVKQEEHEYVDLGLPSGTLWATTNVGAASPADYGDYFAWGETSPKTSYNWSTYKLCNGSSTTLTKYNEYPGFGTMDYKTVLEATDDVATVNWGTDWRMSTIEEQQELNNTSYCTWTWTTRTNSKGETINGYEVKSKSNGNSIFLPAAGYHGGTSLLEVGSYGYYWSSSVYSFNTLSACILYFDSGSPYCYSNDRFFGLSVRPVRASARN